MESGLHFCFVAKDRAAVDAFHAAALRTGGTDNGKPGLRADYGPKYYAAFAIDPDGYRIEAHCGKGCPSRPLLLLARWTFATIVQEAAAILGKMATKTDAVRSALASD